MTVDEIIYNAFPAAHERVLTLREDGEISCKLYNPADPAAVKLLELISLEL